MKDRYQQIMDSIDSFMLPAIEEYSDISVFFKDQDLYLDSYHKNNPEELYTEPLGYKGIVCDSIIKAGRELTKVNAFTEALLLYQTFIERLEIIGDGLARQEKAILENTIDVMQGIVLDTMRARDEYHSKRKATIARYSSLIKSL